MSDSEEERRSRKLQRDKKDKDEHFGKYDDQKPRGRHENIDDNDDDYDEDDTNP